tara:strand:+ start:68 stop:247 length:180 start_codon:yes stop_codon:yes gene_type:complete
VTNVNTESPCPTSKNASSREELETTSLQSIEAVKIAPRKNRIIRVVLMPTFSISKKPPS